MSARYKLHLVAQFVGQGDDRNVSASLHHNALEQPLRIGLISRIAWGETGCCTNQRNASKVVCGT